MDPASFAAVLEALDSRREVEERRREERYTALIERVGMGMTSAATTGPVMVAPKARAQKMTVEDDPEAYLVAFERLATTAAWPREYWASQLGPCLIGEAQAAYRAMTDEDAAQYDLVKQAILRRLNITGETHRVRFREFRRPPNTRPRVVAQRLCDHMAQWLNPSQKTGVQMGEAIVMEQFCHVVGGETQAWIRRHNPTTLDQAVALAENFEDSLMSAQTTLLNYPSSSVTKGPPPNPPGPRPARPPAPSGHPSSLPWRQRLAPSWGRMVSPAPLSYQQRDKYVPPLPSAPPVCFRCQQPGHIARYCPAAMECDVAACHLASETGKEWGNGREGPCVVDVVLGKVKTHALVDTGCEQTLIRTALLGGMSWQPRGQVAISCIHGDTATYPTLKVYLSVGPIKRHLVVGVAEKLPHPIILGRDWPRYKDLVKISAASTTRVGTADPREKEVIGTMFPFHAELFSPLFRPRKTHKERRREKWEGASIRHGWCLAGEGCDGPKRQSKGVGTQCDQTGEVTGPLRVETAPAPVNIPDVWASSADLVWEQNNDPTLVHAWEQVRSIEGKDVDGIGTLVYPHFVVEGHLLYRVNPAPGTGQPVKQLMVPPSCRPEVMRLAHDVPFAGHLGVDKTRDRILTRFYWAGLYTEVAKYVATCPECQRVAPGRMRPAPLVPLPIVSTPFERVAMDIVGPVLPSDSGYTHILVMVDYATRYPEAVPLRSTSATAIAKELSQIMARVGIPKEILTDHGTNFLSKTLQQVYKILKIRPIRTSVYHPQTDGLVERFNQTLKHMLRRFVSQEQKHWATLLPYLLFAVREVPQSSTGFSPFELLYGRQPRGILDLLREGWEEHKSLSKNVVQHVLLLRDRLDLIGRLAQDNLRSAQHRQQQHYNTNAQIRTFRPGDKVMLLLPSLESKLCAKWQGPYEVIRAVGLVNYEIRQPDRRNKTEIYHVNLLKPWKAREVLFIAPGEMEDDLGPCIEAPSPSQISMGEQLLPDQQVELRKLIGKFGDVFSDVPGRTNLTEYAVITPPGVTVRERPYRIPESRRSGVQNEVRAMLELGVIEPSRSEWCSPIVIVAKKDGTNRFCVDFRKVNAIAKFNAYPMPRIDELLDRLGTARFISTLDLTKGYWQIPLTRNSCEKTAFSTPDGLFHFKTMPFGLHGAPAAFQRLMDEVLHPHREYAAAYIDDVVIYSSTWREHVIRLTAVLQSLRAARLTANLRKCAFAKLETQYLGFIMGNGRVKPVATKVQALVDAAVPKTKSQVRSLLGLAGYYRRFIPEYATVVNPLVDLTKKCAPNLVKWSAECQGAFETIKQKLCQAPALISPDFSKRFFLHTDVSEVGLGAVLSQRVNGVEHPILYISKKMLPRERNYSVVEKECLAIKWATHSLRYYLMGHSFDLVTDHAPLRWLSTMKDSNARITRWYLALQPYMYHMVHRAGKDHQNADYFSREGGVMGMVDLAECSFGSTLSGGICEKERVNSCFRSPFRPVRTLGRRSRQSRGAQRHRPGREARWQSRIG
ncbi:uncharacterized protein LOC131720990 [Acipenser ruthenus]|uniref:uncharacterized protein LOC131720990 n=1 Tax=Acipenser ruthenus TaxID=7906 RepID=UPI002741317C|nr:uncharacterized protein LOC131720990 [Acipenser ruthenus]